MVNRTKINDHRLISNGTPMSTDLDININKNIIYSSTTIKPIITVLQKGGFLQEKQFNWIELQQQILLGGYWAGYIFTQVPGK
jgi:hypothetical protein